MVCQVDGAKLMAEIGWVMHKPRISASVARLHSAGDGWRQCASQWMSLKSRLVLWTVWEREDHTAVTQLLTVSWHAAPSQLPSNAFVLAVVVFSNCFPVRLFSSSFSPSHFLLCICCHSFLLSVPWQCFSASSLFLVCSSPSSLASIKFSLTTLWDHKKRKWINLFLTAEAKLLGLLLFPPHFFIW